MQSFSFSVTGLYFFSFVSCKYVLISRVSYKIIIAPPAPVCPVSAVSSEIQLDLFGKHVIGQVMSRHMSMKTLMIDISPKNNMIMIYSYYFFLLKCLSVFRYNGSQEETMFEKERKKERKKEKERKKVYVQNFHFWLKYQTLDLRRKHQTLVCF